MDKVIFISDLHLDECRPEMTALFLKFLAHEAKEAQTLYILGDFFEIWVGDDDLSEFNRTIIQALNKATVQGLPIFILHGNRDFLLGKKFLQMTGCRLLQDEYVLSLFGTPTLLMHGDTLCTGDIKYLKFRKKARNWLFQKLFLIKSLEKRKAIATHYREASQAHTATTPENIMDVTQAEVERLMYKHKVQHLIHGHTHRENVHHFSLKCKPATRTVLGAWHDQGSALICYADGKQELIVLK
jgi:UDP-2,3-diacylglucosamine hydrolase